MGRPTLGGATSHEEGGLLLHPSQRTQVQPSLFTPTSEHAGENATVPKDVESEAFGGNLTEVKLAQPAMKLSGSSITFVSELMSMVVTPVQSRRK